MLPVQCCHSLEEKNIFSYPYSLRCFFIVVLEKLIKKNLFKLFSKLNLKIKYFLKSFSRLLIFR